MDTDHFYPAIPITSVVDKGSELVFLYANQTALQCIQLISFDTTSYPDK